MVVLVVLLVVLLLWKAICSSPTPTANLLFLLDFWHSSQILSSTLTCAPRPSPCATTNVDCGVRRTVASDSSGVDTVRE